MTGRRQLLLVVACALGLLVVAAAQPAADPRLDNPVAGDRSGDGESDGIAGDWESVTGFGDDDATTPTESEPTPAAQSAPPPDPEIEIEGAVEPGNEVTVTVDDADPWEDTTVQVDGRAAGTISNYEGVDVRVPYADEMTVSVPDHGHSRTVDVPTAARIDSTEAAVPGRSLTIQVLVGGTPVPEATVTRDGDPVATTNETGYAAVDLPPAAGPVSIGATRSPVAGEREIQVAEPTVRFTSPLLFPGAPAPVRVAAGDEGVPNATVSVVEGETVRTDADGDATVSLPIAAEATVRVDVGEESATATVGNLYLRLTALIVFVPGFLLGLVVTYLRYVPTRYRYRRGSTLAFFVGLADVLASLADLFRLPSVSLGTPSVALPSVSWPRLPSFSWPSPGFSLSGLGGVGSLFGLFGRDGDASTSGGISPSLSSLFGLSEDEDDATDHHHAAADGEESADEGDAAPLGPRAEIRAAWHGFVDRLDVEDRTATAPGAIARRAVAAGFPASHVRPLLGAFRAVEYGDREPTTERLATARAAAEALSAHVPDEEGAE